MKFLKTNFIWLLILGLVLDTLAQTKVLEYDIFVNNINIGIMRAKKTVEGINTKIEIQSNVDVDLIYRYKVFVTTYSKYQGNQLVEAYVKKVANKKVKEEALIKWLGDKYSFKSLEESFSIENKIAFCTSRLYFEEPKNVKNCVAISLGKLVEFKKIGESKYKFEFPDGTTNTYDYNSEGICKLVRPGFKLVRIEFKLRN